ncbi:MAG TPA: acetylglutamate kinase [Planktothrix sp.]|jgi:acetylglutamate kinase
MSVANLFEHTVNSNQMDGNKAAMNSQKIVVKLGGAILDTQQNLQAVIEQLAALYKQGHEITVVHGAGPQINNYLKTQGVVPEFCNGWRITDAQTLMAVFAALGEVNAAIVQGLEAVGIPAASMHAAPDLFTCNKKTGITTKGASVDLGWVGEIISTDVSSLSKHSGAIAVVSPMGWDQYQNKYNINADAAAFALAAAMGADRLVFMSDVPGVLKDKNDSTSIVATLDAERIETLIATGAVSAGMVPKLMNSLASAQAGVKSVSIISGTADSALTELVHGEPIGTTVVAGDWRAEFRPRSLTSAGAA